MISFDGVDIADTPDVQLLSFAIRTSGLSVRKFGAQVLMLPRDARSVPRWLKGQEPIPSHVVALCVQYLARKRAAL